MERGKRGLAPVTKSEHEYDSRFLASWSALDCWPMLALQLLPLHFGVRWIVTGSRDSVVRSSVDARKEE